MADHRLLPLLIATIVLCSPLAGNARDKHALVQKLLEVSDVSNQIKAGALAATAPIMDHIRKTNPDLPDDTFNYIQSKIQAELSTEMATFMDKWAYPLIENDYSVEELQYIYRVLQFGDWQETGSEDADRDAANDVTPSRISPTIRASNPGCCRASCRRQEVQTTILTRRQGNHLTLPGP